MKMCVTRGCGNESSEFGWCNDCYAMRWTINKKGSDILLKYFGKVLFAYSIVDKDKYVLMKNVADWKASNGYVLGRVEGKKYSVVFSYSQAMHWLGEISKGLVVDEGKREGTKSK